LIDKEARRAVGSTGTKKKKAKRALGPTGTKKKEAKRAPRVSPTASPRTGSGPIGMKGSIA
jgi:hypothetical protein